jgi:cell division cycle 20-like protein 1 (cofactor of APC complex)
MIWSNHSSTPISKFNQHSAAVKALAWSPHTHGVLASGGGSADRTIKFWNTLEGNLLDSIDTGSQVCNLMFSKTTK